MSAFDWNIFIHIGYTGALVYFVFKSGYKAGRKELCEEFIENKLVTLKKLAKHYKLKDIEEDPHFK